MNETPRIVDIGRVVGDVYVGYVSEIGFRCKKYEGTQNQDDVTDLVATDG